MLNNKIESQRNLLELRKVVRGQKVSDGSYTVDQNEVLVSNELLSIFTSKDDLTKYVRLVEANNGHGTYPHFKMAGAELASVPELEQGAPIPDMNIIDVAYTIETYRGQIPISMEVLEDNETVGLKLVEVLAREAKQIDINTKNKVIINTFKGAAAATVTGQAELIDLVNSYPTAYDVKLFLSSSLYSLLDNADLIDYAKDYPRFKGKEIIRIDDAKIGTTQGDLVGFVGDAYSYMHLFDRKSVTLSHKDYTVFSTVITVATRFDVEVADIDAGNYITFTQS